MQFKLLSILALAIASTSAASIALSPETDIAGYEDQIRAIAATMPKCAMGCMTTLAPAAGCPIPTPDSANYTCHCAQTSHEFIKKVEVCAYKACHGNIVQLKKARKAVISLCQIQYKVDELKGQ